MPLSKKTFLLIAFSCIALAFSIFLYTVGLARATALQNQKAQLISAQQQVEQLRRDVERYESTRGQLQKEGGGDIARHEKVSISSTFTPAELPQINSLLAHAYDTDGFLLLRSFSLRWSETGGEDNKPLEAGLSLNLNGEKIFTQ